MQWASSGFSTWTLVIFNISRLVTISNVLKNYNKQILIGFIILIILILVLNIPVALVFNNNSQNCIIMLNDFRNNACFMLIAFVFFVALFLYFLGSYVLLPVIGLIMTIKVIKIRKDSRKLIAIVKTQNSKKKINRADIRLLISQILVSFFSITFNLPMIITSFLNISMTTDTLYIYNTIIFLSNITSTVLEV